LTRKTTKLIVRISCGHHRPPGGAAAEWRLDGRM